MQRSLYSTRSGMRGRLLCVIGVGLWSATPVARQAPAVLPGELRAHVQNARFDVVSSIRGLPLGVRGELQALFGSPTLDIAEPDTALRAAGQTPDARAPIRRFVAAGCSYEDCLVYYERVGSPSTWRVALFHWTPAASRFEWGGSAPGGLKTIDDVRRAVLSGAIASAAGPW